VKSGGMPLYCRATNRPVRSAHHFGNWTYLSPIKTLKGMTYEPRAPKLPGTAGSGTFPSSGKEGQ
jgi:hypothetical protein